VVAGCNSAGSIIKYIEKISDQDIIYIEISYSGIIKYGFDKSLRLRNKKII